MDSTVIGQLADSLTRQAGFDGIDKREEIRVWSLSGVERLHVWDNDTGDLTTVVFKYARPPFTAEAANLAWLQRCGVPVPELYASDQRDGVMGMLIEDLGTQTRDATIGDAAQAAVAAHHAPRIPGVIVLDTARLAQLPSLALARLNELQQVGRWRDGVAYDITDELRDLEQIASQRAEGAEIPPWGLCHSEFHPTSVHINDSGWRLLDWARAFTGPGLLDLASWQNTVESPDCDAFNTLLDAYIDAGGDPAAKRDRGGLAPARWAYGWHRLWVIDWFLEQCTTWIADPAKDDLYQRTIRRHLNEALECLIPTG